MDYPDWPPRSQKEMLLAVARCVFEMHYRNERHRTKGLVKTFDNMGQGDLESAASVLENAGFTRYLDDIGRRSEFVCEPDEFYAVANSDDAKDVDCKQIEIAVVRLAEGGVASSSQIDNLAKEINKEVKYS